MERQQPLLNAAQWVAPVEAALARLVEIPAALLVVAEIVVLLAGVIWRYVLHSPLIWSDELASTLFLWLAMLGSVVALQRNEHMRMTALVGKASPQTRAFLEVVAVAVPVLFLSLMVMPGVEFAIEEDFITTPALDISGAWHAAAFPVGSVLMLVVALLRLARTGGWQALAGGIGLVAGIAAIFVAAAPVLHELGNINLLIFFVLLVGTMVLAGVPIAFAFGIATLGYIGLTTNVPDIVLVGRMNEGMAHLILLAVPLFVVLGLLMEMTGIARTMVAFLVSLLGHVRGGLYYVLVGAMYLVSGISGSKAADMAAIAPVLFPEMQKRGEPEGELLALLSATGAQTETIPPSLVLITIGSVTGVSIAALFTGGLLPGLVLGLVLCLVVRWRLRGKVTPGTGLRASWGTVGKCFVIALPGLALPFVIRWAVISGATTATEVSTIGIAYAVIVGVLVYRSFDLKRLMPMLVETASLSGAILLIIGAATAMSWALTQSGFSQSLAAAMAALPGGQATFLAVSILAFIVLGSVLEGIPAIVLFGPLLFPIARQMGVHEVHYAMVVILSMGVGLFAPPFGVGYYSACAVSRIHPDAGLKPILPYLLALIIGVAVIAAIPWISIGFL
ncbi:TRAP transporter large permease subunit [Rhodovastum atsumiense]|uniref:TRAP transporter large permease subunit n=2 Tax=Rhodovastum atsumiense TaxID=504468 RepID=A0A5M6J4D4_9PROT|nr:TRAP transporter large permease subunit [Rhodovastum atsumiense]CAH2604828.1 TRAP transporter large permease subunit [Rhodovastum atsumiense]